MKKTLILITMSLTILMGCSDNQSTKMKDISLSFSGLEFTKTVNDAEKHFKVEGNKLILEGIHQTNYFISPDGSRMEASAPILLTQINNQKSFTFSTRMQSSIENKYDAGTLYLYVNDNDWLKFAFELDEKGRRRVVTVRTKNTSDDNNHDIITQDYVYMKISSDTKQIGFYYSTNGTDWNLARLYRNEYPANLWIGISSQSPGGKGNIAYFEDMTFTETSVTSFRLGE